MSEQQPAETELDLKRLVARGLRHYHGRRLLSESDRSGGIPTSWGELFSWVFMLWFTLGVGWFVAQRLGWSPGLPWVGGIALVLVLPIIASGLGSPGFGAWMLVIAFVVTAVIQLASGGVTALLGTHVLPGLLVLAGAALTRVTGLTRSAPLLLPVIIRVLFIPLFTGDLWLAASRLSEVSYLALAGVTLLPLMVAVYWQLSPDIPAAFGRARDRIRNRTHAETRAVELLRRLGSEERSWLDQHQPRAVLADTFGSAFIDDATELARSELASRFRRLLVWRLLSTAVGVATLVAVYSYVLAVVAIRQSTVHEWVGRPAATQKLVPLMGIPVGPYVQVGLLFGLVATAAFLAFALTEERYRTAISDLMVARPIEDVLVLAIPYRALTAGRGGQNPAPPS